ncbi:OsmC family protein [Agromyces sp. LHK192]|uniref:OsmC family protein n=1 Tax=Agromyces sp. LHK192 TaxID=2498704 RepID=UPI000FDA397F|nr:OsmC family protein [Agromyces sp. LHK192]
MLGEHGFRVELEWTGETPAAVSGPTVAGAAPARRSRVTSAARSHVVRADGKLHAIEGSAARPFHGDPARWNPEELLLAALADCHLLSYLYVAARAGVVVTAYRDDATATLRQDARGGGAIIEAVLRPRVGVAEPAMVEVAQALHAEASALCFIASSVAFPIRHEPVAEVVAR